MKLTKKANRGVYMRGKIYWLAIQRNGVRRFVSLETGDYVEALTRADRIRGIESFIPAKTELQKAIDSYLSEKVAAGIYTNATVRITKSILEEFQKIIGDTPLELVSSKHAAAHYARLQDRVKETTAQIHMRALKAFFNHFRKGNNPFDGIQLKKVIHYARTKFCTKAQRDAIIAAATSDEMRFVLYAGFHAGMRKNEIIEARVGWFMVGEDGGAVHVQNTESFTVKDKEARAIPLTPDFSQFLKGFLEGREPHEYAVKPGRVRQKASAVYRWDFFRPFHDVVKAAGCPWVTAHVMRHTFASLLVQNGVSIYKVAQWLGDGVGVVEKHYAHLSTEDPDIKKML